MVITVPSNRLIKGFAVAFFNSCSILPPVIRSKETDIRCIPYRKKASPPPNDSREKKSNVMVFLLF